MDEEQMNQLNAMQFNHLLSNKFVKDSPIQAIGFKAYETPNFVERNYKKYVLAGFDNLWPKYLLRLKANCAIHNAIVDSKVRQVAGEGLTIEDTNDKEQLSKLTAFLKKIKINKSIKRIAEDQQTFGYWFMGITWNAERTKIANLYHVDASTIRVGVPNSKGIVEHFYYSEDWSRYTNNDFRPKKIQRFNPEKRIDENCLIMVRGYRPDTRFYNLPSYEGARSAIELVGELSEYMLNSIKNGLSPSLNIAFNNGEPTEEEKQVIYNSINSLYAGSRNAGRYILSFNKSKENATTVEPIQTSNLSQMYASLADFAKNQIIVGHKTYPILVGVDQPGSLGNSAGEVERLSEQFYEFVINPAQTEITDTIQELLEINGFNLNIWIKDVQPISYAYDDSTLLSIMTIDELRARINLAPLSENDKKNLGINISQLADGTKEVTEIKDETKLSADGTVPVQVNDNIKNLSPKQHQQLMRIIRQFSRGQLTEEAATTLLKVGLGLSPEDIASILGANDTSDDAEFVNEQPKAK